MDLQKYIEKKIKIQEDIILFIDDEYMQENFEDFFNENIEDYDFIQDRHEFKLMLYFILKIANNHHRSSFFFDRIEQIINFFKDPLQQTFTSSEIFNIFKSNKRLLLFLIKENILAFDSSIAKTLSDLLYNFQSFKYQNYLLPEIESFLDKKTSKKIRGEITKNLNIRVKNLAESTEYEEKRKVGENESYICKLIRNDSIKEFVIYINETNMKLTSQTKTSIYETNPFLLKRGSSTLIEYSAFYGSIQILKYLLLNGVDMTPSIWLYAIHGRNPEIIHFIEENNIRPPSDSYTVCLNESLKCHHYEITNYILETFLTNNDDKNLFYASAKYLNFKYFPDDLSFTKTFYYLCKYDYFEIVKFLMNKEDFNLEIQLVYF